MALCLEYSGSLTLTRYICQAGTNEPIKTTFDMNDTLYAHATVLPEDTDEVFLWLGANVMLAYPIDEAETLLEDKLQAAEASFKNCEEDMEFLREQVTVSSSLTWSSRIMKLTN